jgi:hypothetical protein
MSKRIKPETDIENPEPSQTMPTDLPIPPPITGTVDGDDDPADENGAIREQNERVLNSG